MIRFVPLSTAAFFLSQQISFVEKKNWFDLKFLSLGVENTLSDLQNSKILETNKMSDNGGLVKAWKLQTMGYHAVLLIFKVKRIGSKIGTRTGAGIGEGSFWQNQCHDH